MEHNSQYEYAGFWVRFGATLIDSILFLMLTMPILYLIYGSYYFESESFILGGWDLLLNWIFPFIATVLFWVYRSATPGKIALKLKVVDAKTGEPLSTSKSIIRYLAYYVSTIPLCLGFIWVVFSGKKQGWHDMISNTVVIRPKKRGVEAVEFENRA
ncbi:RDD family protein [Vibrio parahaemolyticus]|nr:RDD family protein [Vibrio parahaemolyticus]EIZ1178783.1 RDD family protein [Vibrio parahaemolyticus]EJE8531321.1 RDD family protein [Vibrio parahaemolyticus]EJG1101237.1 RDD family protein [Vibrio parahaemolyticus]